MSRKECESSQPLNLIHSSHLQSNPSNRMSHACKPSWPSPRFGCIFGIRPKSRHQCSLQSTSNLDFPEKNRKPELTSPRFKPTSPLCFYYKKIATILWPQGKRHARVMLCPKEIRVPSMGACPLLTKTPKTTNWVICIRQHAPPWLLVELGHFSTDFSWIL